MKWKSKSLALVPEIFFLVIGVMIFVPEHAAAQAPGADKAAALMDLNVRNMGVPEVLKLIADKGQLNLAIGTGVTGNVTLYVQQVPVRDLLTLVVEMVGAAYVEEEGVIRVITQDIFQRTYGRPYHENRQVQWIPLEHVSVQQVVSALGALRSEKGQIVPDIQTNSLLVVETPETIQQIRRYLASVDKPQETREFFVENLPPRQMADRLKLYIPSLAKVEPDPAGNRVLVTASKSTLDRAARILGLLDTSEPLETRSFPLYHAGPDTVRQAIQPLLTPDVAQFGWMNAPGGWWSPTFRRFWEVWPPGSPPWMCPFDRS